MKIIYIIVAILVLGVTAGILQQSKLRDLQHRTAAVMSETSPVKLKRDPSSSVREAAKVSPSDMESMVEDFAAAFLAFKDRSGTDRAEKAARTRRMMLASAKFGTRDIEELFQKLRNDPRLAEAGDDAPMDLCLKIFRETAPGATMGFLEGHRNLPDWEGHYASCFRNYLASNPRDAIRWFDEQAALGNPAVAESSMRSAILLGEAHVDPERMLSRAVSPGFVSESDALSHLGGFVASTLDDVSEHRQFLAALRRAQEKDAESPALAKIRTGYIGGISSDLAGFPFQDASAIMDSEFTSAEKLKFAASECHRADLDGLEKWADWFLKIGYDDWKMREVTPGSPPDHPASAVLETWAESDWRAAGKWLEKVPPGPLKSEMVERYSWRIAAIDPDRAATYIPEISDGKERRSLVKKIAKTLESKDPEAAAVFRAANSAAR